jgi:ribonuclease III
VIRKPDVLARKLGLNFNDSNLLVQALTHRSMGAKNNERLEYLGDSVLGYVIAEQLYTMFPKAGEGVLSRLRASLVNQGSLADLAREHDFGEYLILGSGELKSGGYRRDSILSDALEAIMGALVIDQGVDVCRKWILTVFAEKLDELDADNWNKDPKTRLQELMQSRQLDLPVYELLDQTGAAHDQMFKVSCAISLTQDICVADGSSRKRAEQAAAEKMLKYLKSNKL